MESFENFANAKRITLQEGTQNSKDLLVLRRRDGRAYRIIKSRWESGVPFIFVDTGYFLGSPKICHRMIINHTDLQTHKTRPDDRWKLMQDKGAELLDWKSGGDDILICPPTNKACNLYGFKSPEWTTKTISELKQHTDRKIIIREKPIPRERRTGNSLKEFIEQNSIHAVVSFLGATATESAMLGIPVFFHPDNAATPVGLTDLKLIETPNRPDREQWIHNVSYSQFTLKEIKDGVAWGVLKEDLRELGYEVI